MRVLFQSLTDRLLRMKAWDSDLEEEGGEEGGEKETSNGRAAANRKGDATDAQGHLQNVQKLIYAAKVFSFNGGETKPATRLVHIYINAVHLHVDCPLIRRACVFV